MARMVVLSLALFAVGHAGTADEFDYVIVGGGVAGSIMANRLSESGTKSVLLLNVAGAPPEAYRGPVLLSDELIVQHNLSANMGLALKITQPGYAPQREFSVAETGSSPARWLGGSSLVGLSLYLRDHPETLNAWGESWGWEHMRPYFHKVENLAETCNDGHESCGDYGTDGMVHIAKEPAYTHPLTKDFIVAAKAAGLQETRELNTDHDDAVGVMPTAQHKDGTKVHAFDAYLRPALGRSNLHIRDGARADRLIINGSICRGVVFRDLATSEDKTVYARRQVILSAGYVYTPRLLFLSGIGAADELRRVGLPVVHELPAVGKHVTSARYSPMSWSTDKVTLAQMLGPPISVHDELTAPSAYQSTVQEALARFRSQKAVRSDPAAKRPDVALTFMPSYQALKSAPLQFSFQGEPWPLQTNAYTILVTLGETEATGEVTFTSDSPDDSPVLTHEPLTSSDWELAQEAIQFAMKIGNHSALGGEFMDNEAGRRHTFSALYDGRGSCRMGAHAADSVVDSKLRVHGIGGLRIVDGSVIPQSSLYMAMPEVMALAERAADFVLMEQEEEEAERVAVITEVGKLTSDQVKPAETVTEQVSYYSIEKLKINVGAHASLMEMVGFMAVTHDSLIKPDATGSLGFLGVAPVGIGAPRQLLCLAIALFAFALAAVALTIGLKLQQDRAGHSTDEMMYEPLVVLA